MDWISVSTSTLRDPKVAAFAVKIGVHKLQAVGHLIGVWSALAEHGDELGHIADVPDSELEDWALWRGRKSLFAKQFRAFFQDKDGNLHAWEERNGSKIKKARAEAARKRTFRRMSAGQSADADADRMRSGAGTEQDSTDTTSAAASAGAGAHFSRFEDDAACEAYMLARRAHQDPAGFDHGVQQLADPIGGNGFGWEVVGKALVEMRANGVAWNLRLARGYCARIATPPPEPVVAAGASRKSRAQRTYEALEDWVKEEQA